MFFDVALSGVNASSAQLATTGTNIANSGTAGFKTSQSIFSNVMSANMNAGTQMSTVSQLFSQGTITTSASPTDMAINGAGFFVVKDALTGQTTYTRDGQFTVNAAGNLVNTKGGQLVGSTGAPIAISNVPSPALTTTAITTSQYLDPTVAAIPAATAFNPAVPASYTTMNSIQAFDALGNAQAVNLYYAKSVAGNSATGTGDAFNVYSTSGAPSAIQNLGSITMNPITGGILSYQPGVPAASATNAAALVALSTAIAADTTAAAGITTGAPSATTLAAYATVYGSGAVAPATIAASAIAPVLAPPVAGGIALTGTAGALAAALATAPTFVTAAAPAVFSGVSISGPAATGPKVTVNMAGVSTALQTVNSMAQNGYAAGALTAYTIGNDGKINATYSNNQTAVLGTVELANFRAPNGLQSLGNNYWAATAASGAATTGTPGSNGLGSLQGSAYESSNVDMTKELVNLMAAQRNYQANSQTIKAQDQLLQTMTSLR